MSKRPLPTTSSNEPNRKRSSFRFARDPSGPEVVANSTKIGQRPGGRVKPTKQNTPLASESVSVSSSTIAPLPMAQDQPLQLDDQITIDQEVAPEVLSMKAKRKKRTSTTSVSNNTPHDYDHLI